MKDDEASRAAKPRKHAASIRLTETSKEELEAFNQQLLATEQQLRASLRQLLDTEQALREQNRRLEESEASFRSVFEAANVGKSLTRISGEVVANRAFCELLGYEAEELARLRWQDITPPEDVAAIDALVAPLLAGETDGLRFEKRYLRKDGSILWGDVSVALRRDETGRPLHYITTVVDIGRRKEAQRRLEIERDRADTLIDAAPNIVVLLDARTRIERFNAFAERCTGYEAAEVLGKDWIELFIPPEEREAIHAVWNEVVASASMALHHENRIVTRTGEERWIRWSNSVLTEDGRFRAVLSIGEDVTERRAMEAKMAQQDRLSSMGMLAAGVAHEINNPLSFVLYNLDCLGEELAALRSEDGLDPARLTDMRARFAETLEGMRRIRDIARGLSTFSRVERDDLAPVDLHEAIDQAARMAHNELRYRATLIREYGELPRVSANAGRLSQVFLNLVINAAHAIAEGDVEGNEIRIRTWSEGKEIFVTVSDTGPGIAPETLARIFEPFFSTKRIGRGSGLGLSISKNIVEGYGGTLTATSAPGRGTTFLVRLPALPTPREEAPPSPPPGPEPTPRGRILIVDDEDCVRSSMRRMLARHETVEAVDGVAARELLERDDRFDLVLCDVMMPRGSGIDLHRWLVETRPDLARRLVFVTGGAFTPTAETYLSQVENLRLEKPLRVEAFRRIVAARIRAAREDVPSPSPPSDAPFGA